MNLILEQKDFYRRNGYIKLSGVFTEDEMNNLSKEYDLLFSAKSNQELEAAWEGDEMKKQANNIDYSVKSIHNVQFHSSAFTELLMNKKLLDVVEDIMGTPNILLHHTKAHLKPPENGAPYLMHQDYHYFPFKKHSMIAVFIHFDDTTPENGGLAVYPGSHLLGPLPDKGITTDKQSYHYVDQKRFPLEKATPINAKRGDVVIFSYLLVHGSYLNLSDRVRRMLLIQLMSSDDEPVADIHKSPAQGLVLRGRNTNRNATFLKRLES